MVQRQWLSNSEKKICLSNARKTQKMKKKTKKFILEFLDFWPLTIVVPLMLLGILLGAALGWGG